MCKHCWHTLMHIVANPTQDYQVCCFCGDLRLVALEPRELNVHGPHKPIGESRE